MKKFKYRLEALLKMKEHIEKERQKKLAAKIKQVQDKQGELASVDQSRERTFDRQRQEAESNFSVAEMLVISRYLHKLKRDTVVGQELLKALMKEQEQRRQELLEASRERKKYEKLKEKQQKRHHQNTESILTKESDETAVNTYRQKAKSAPS